MSSTNLNLLKTFLILFFLSVLAGEQIMANEAWTCNNWWSFERTSISPLFSQSKKRTYVSEWLLLPDVFAAWLTHTVCELTTLGRLWIKKKKNEKEGTLFKILKTETPRSNAILFTLNRKLFYCDAFYEQNRLTANKEKCKKWGHDKIAH